MRLLVAVTGLLGSQLKPRVTTGNLSYRVRDFSSRKDEEQAEGNQAFRKKTLKREVIRSNIPPYIAEVLNLRELTSTDDERFHVR